MLTKTFYRWSAGCTLAGAALLTTGYWLRPDIEKELMYDFATTKALVSSILVAGGTLILLAGLPGLFAKQARHTGKWGLLASGLSFTGIAAFHLGTIALYFVLPVLIQHGPETRALIYSDVPPFPRFALFWAAGLLIQVAGFIWLGIKSWQAGVYPKPAVILLLAGSVLLFSAPLLSFHLLKPGTTVVMAGLMWCAVRLFLPFPGTVKTAARMKTYPVYD